MGGRHSRNKEVADGAEKYFNALDYQRESLLKEITRYNNITEREIALELLKLIEQKIRTGLITDFDKYRNIRTKNIDLPIISRLDELNKRTSDSKKVENLVQAIDDAIKKKQGVSLRLL